jgi:hypothetical protein
VCQFAANLKRSVPICWYITKSYKKLQKLRVGHGASETGEGVGKKGVWFFNNTPFKLMLQCSMNAAVQYAAVQHCCNAA